MAKLKRRCATGIEVRRVVSLLWRMRLVPALTEEQENALCTRVAPHMQALLNELAIESPPHPMPSVCGEQFRMPAPSRQASDPRTRPRYSKEDGIPTTSPRER